MTATAGPWVFGEGPDAANAPGWPEIAYVASRRAEYGDMPLGDDEKDPSGWGLVLLTAAIRRAWTLNQWDSKPGPFLEEFEFVISRALDEYVSYIELPAERQQAREALADQLAMLIAPKLGGKSGDQDDRS